MGSWRFRPCCGSGERLSGWVELEGAVNVRDLGGLPVAGGGVTAPGVLWRSDNLQGLSASDVDLLSERIGVVVDLRTSTEVTLEGPGPLVGHVEHRHRSLYPERGSRTDVAVEDIMIGTAPIVDVYLGYLRHRPDSIAAALSDIATAGSGAALVHCAAGKDRTGVVVALALSAAGVSREAIIADYVATASRIGAIMARLRASPTYAPDLDDEPDETHAPRASTLQHVFEFLDSGWGGPVGWLEAQGLDTRALRARLVA